MISFSSYPFRRGLPLHPSLRARNSRPFLSPLREHILACRRGAAGLADTSDQRLQRLFPAVEKIVGADRFDDPRALEDAAALFAEVGHCKDDISLRQDL